MHGTLRIGVALGATALLLQGCSVAGYPSGHPAWDPAPVSSRGSPSSGDSNVARTYEVFGETYAVLASAEGYQEEGVASWYGDEFHGRSTANGERYDMDSLSAAHRSLPFDTWVEVENLENGRSIRVRINDRGPFARTHERIIDLSRAAARELGMIAAGTARVRVRAISSSQE
jgi:rare lipoprotein A